MARLGTESAATPEQVALAASLLEATLDPEEALRALCKEARRVLEADEAVVLLPDVDGDPAVAASDGSAEGWAEGAHPGLKVPLRRRGAPDGALEVRWLGPRVPDRADEGLLRALAGLAAGALRNAEDHAAVQRAASVDSLTGCLNHGAFQSRLHEEVSRAGRGAEPFTLALIDIDALATVNERSGHLAGDAILRATGELLRGVVRLHDIVARFGGDEFALLLPATDPVTAQAIVDRTLEALGRVGTPDGAAVGAGAGLASWRWGDQASDVIERAEAALREAKRRRGERVVTAPGPHAAPARSDRRTLRLAVAGELGVRLSRLLDSTAIARTAVGDVNAALGYEHCALVRLEDGRAVEVAAAGDGPALPPVRPSASPVARCLRELRPVLVADAAQDPAYSGRLPDGVRSVLAVPLHAGSELWGAVEVCSAAPGAFEPSDGRLVQTIADHVGGALHTAQLYRELEETYTGTAAALAAALEAKDDHTADHAQSIADLAVDVGRRLGLDDRALRDLRYGAIFHDIGKIAVPDAILHKPGRLTEREFDVVKRHPVTGEQILAPVPFLAGVRRIVRHDHERWDGTGYPDGLRAEEIPIGARIVLVVDAWHAMTSDRPYRHGMPEEDARAQLRDGAGTQFDPAVVEAFLEVLETR